MYKPSYAHNQITKFTYMSQAECRCTSPKCIHATPPPPPPPTSPISSTQCEVYNAHTNPGTVTALRCRSKHIVVCTMHRQTLAVVKQHTVLCTLYRQTLAVIKQHTVLCTLYRQTLAVIKQHTVLCTLYRQTLAVVKQHTVLCTLYRPWQCK